MITITSYKRFDDETDEELIYRICKDKDKIGSWQNVADVINELTGNDYGESTYRKNWWLDANEIIEKGVADHIITDIEELF